MIRNIKIHFKTKGGIIKLLSAVFIIALLFVYFYPTANACHDNDCAFNSECQGGNFFTCYTPVDTRYVVRFASQCPANPDGTPATWCIVCPPPSLECIREGINCPPPCPPPLAPVCDINNNASCSQTDTTHRDDMRDFIYDYWVPVFAPITEQFSATMMHQVQIIGTFLDAKIFLETLAMIQGLEAETHKRYRVHEEICMIGTTIRSLAASEEKYKTNARLLSEIMMDRETLSENSVGATGFSGDKISRFRTYTNVHCDINDNNGTLTNICNPPNNDRANNDINFARTVEKNLTLDIDFTDGVPTDDEEDVIALSKNLFANSIMKPIPEKLLLQEYAKDDIMDVRSVVALRGIARNSWGHIVGIRSTGTPEAAPFIQSIASQFGVPNSEIDAFIGENPSYFAQMNAITKKLFQSPEFYTNLYTTPDNVDRTGVALQALKIMQDRDRFDSSLRREMLVSVMLEVRLRELQEELDNELLGMTTLYAVDPY
jgi:hypothetical protein